jgi:hypothetical protein
MHFAAIHRRGNISSRQELNLNTGQAGYGGAIAAGTANRLKLKTALTKPGLSLLFQTALGWKR